MATSKLKRVSAPTETAVNQLATREGRSFVSQLDRVVDAGMKALGEPLPNRETPTTAATPATPAKKAPPAKAPKAAKATT